MPEYVIKVTTEEVIPKEDFALIEAEVAHAIWLNVDSYASVKAKLEYA